MNKKGFASMYIVYSFFLICITLVFSTMLINNYKKDFLIALKNDIKIDLDTYQFDKISENDLKNEENIEEK